MAAQSLGSKDAVADLILMETITNEDILTNLKNRFSNDQIYTYIGSVLISVNPFKEIQGLYAKIKQYQGRYIYENPPHVYALAEDTYRALLTDHADQSVIISGESGAGKTEASKKIMQYIAAVTGGGTEIERVKDQILKSNPVLEAFGNAQTVRNNNSSRFGKYMEIFFDFKGDPIGGKISNYLLEKSRVVQPAKGERSFHVFYQMMAGMSAQEKTQLHLTSPEQFRYLAHSETYTVKGMNDAKEHALCHEGLKAMGLTDSEVRELFQIVSAVLWIGQVDFTETKDRAEIQNEDAVRVVAELLQCDFEKLKSAFVARHIEAGRGEQAIKTFLNKEKAIYTRDSLAKVIYFRLFDQVVRFINHAIEVTAEDTTTIGVLDIYGFEIFESNSFEQFCINFVNEKLQQIFISKVIQQEQEEYKAEGIAWEPIQYFNNKIVCDLIEKKPQGVLAYLDEESILGKGTDESFLNKLQANFAKHAHFARPMGVKQSRDEFTIKHYAGDVNYNVTGFLDKNKDFIWKDLLAVGESSQISFFGKMFPKGASERMGKTRPVTAGTFFKDQVARLMATLDRCQPHYIRCIKPNDRKQGNIFQDDMVMHQIKYLGLLENVRVRRAGFAFRLVYSRFVQRYKMICSRTWKPVWRGSDQEGTQIILSDAKFTEGKDFQMGKTKVFLREPQTLFALEEQREKALHQVVIGIQRIWRSYRARKFFLELREKSLGLFGRHKLRRKISVRRYYVGDYTYARNDPKIAAIMTRDSAKKIRFSDEVDKINRKHKPQKRQLFLTDKHLYNFKPGLIQKRRIDIQKIAAVSLSSKADGFFVLHITGEYDYVFVSDRKTEFVTALNEEFERLTGKPLELKFSDNISYKTKKGATQTVTFHENKASDQVTYQQNPSSSSDLAVQVGANIEVVNEHFLSSLAPAKMSAKSASKPVSKFATPAKGGGGGGGASSPSSSSSSSPISSSSSSSSPAASKAPPPHAKKNEIWAVAIDDYKGGEGELNFKRGDKIKVLEQDPSGWWLCQLGSQAAAYAPNTFLDLCT